jgi:hypothetical protein
MAKCFRACPSSQGQRISPLACKSAEPPVLLFIPCSELFPIKILSANRTPFEVPSAQSPQESEYRTLPFLINDPAIQQTVNPFVDPLSFHASHIPPIVCIRGILHPQYGCLEHSGLLTVTPAGARSGPSSFQSDLMSRSHSLSLDPLPATECHPENKRQREIVRDLASNPT